MFQKQKIAMRLSKRIQRAGAQIGLVIALFLGGGNTFAQISAAEIRQLAQPYTQSGQVVGMTIGVLYRSEPVVVGVGKLGRQDPRTPDGDTVYEIGSLTKVLTGVLLADAVTRGEITLDTTLAELGWVATPGPRKHGGPRKDQRPGAITLRQLATHTSGLPRLPQNLALTDLKNPYATYTLADLKHAVAKVHLENLPGDQASYSNLGLGLLGDALAEKAGGRYAEVLAERVFKPLGMSDSAVVATPAMQERLAAPHTSGGEPSSFWDFQALAGAGGVKSTANDVLKLVAASLAPENVSLGPALALAWRVHQTPLKEGDLASGLGWFVAQDGQTRWHNGQTGGFYSIVLANRELDIAVVVLANTATSEVETLANDVLLATLGIPVEPREFPQGAEVPVAHLDRLVGEYKIGNRFIFTVTRREQQLFVQLTGQPALLLLLDSPMLWRYRDIENAAVRFDVDDQGQVASLTLLQHGIEQTALRVGDVE